MDKTKINAHEMWMRLLGLALVCLAGVILYDSIKFAYSSIDSAGYVTSVEHKVCGSKYKRTCYEHKILVDGLTATLTLDDPKEVGSRIYITYVRGEQLKTKVGWVGKWPAEFIWNDVGAEVTLFLGMGFTFLVGIDRSIEWITSLIVNIFTTFKLTLLFGLLSKTTRMIIGDVPEKTLLVNNIKSDIPIPQFLAIGFLFWTLFDDHDESFFILLRIIVSGASFFVAYRAYKVNRLNWVWVSALAAIIYNPFSPFYLEKSYWNLVNFISIAFFIASVLAFHASGIQRNSK